MRTTTFLTQEITSGKKMEEEEEQKEVNNFQQGTSEGQDMLTKSVGTINSVLRPFEVYVPNDVGCQH